MSSSTLDPKRLARLLDVGRDLVSELDLDALLDRVVRTAQELTGARYAALGVLDAERQGLARFITAGVDESVRRTIGEPPHGRGVLGVLIEDPRPLRLDDVAAHPRAFGFPASHPPMRSFLGVPVLIRGEAWGNLYLTEKRDGPFDALDELAAVVLSEWAAIAVSNARAVSEQRLRDSLAAAEAERARWARELHDQTLQGLAAVRVGLAGAARTAEGDALRAAVADAMELLGDEIAALRAIVADLRPAALDELGLEPAIRTLSEATHRIGGPPVVASVNLERRLDPELETTVYRLVQEALANVRRHAGATRAEVRLRTRDGHVLVDVVDDGRGFDADAAHGTGFGLRGMRERAALAGGTISIAPGPDGGMAVHVALPLAAPEPEP